MSKTENAPSDNTPSYRMRDLCNASGLERQAIHFYIQRGLLPPGTKTGRNTAVYSKEHLERLRLIRQLKEERFLPLKAIKAILDGRDGEFTPAQRVFLGNVKQRLRDGLSSTGAQGYIDIADVIVETRLDRADIEDAISLGIVTANEDHARILRCDLWFLELFGKLRSLGFTKERGFVVADVAVYERALHALFRDELALLTRRLADEPPEEVATMIRDALPVLHTFLARQHSELIHEFLKTPERSSQIRD